MKLFTLALAVATLTPALGQDLDTMKNFVGSYPIHNLNGTTALTGVLEIVADAEEGIGYRLVDVFSEANADNVQVLTPAFDTGLATQGVAVVQEYKTDDYSLRVEYRRNPEGVELRAVRCPVNSGCELTLVNNESAVVDNIDPARFFPGIAGGYKIELVGGEHPHDGNDSADISTSGGEANLTFPYCQNAGGLCDPGYIDLPYASTKVSRKLVSAGRYLYTITSGTQKYTWEERGGLVYFRNYQYRLASGRFVTLTHVLKKR